MMPGAGPDDEASEKEIDDMVALVSLRNMLRVVAPRVNAAELEQVRAVAATDRRLAAILDTPVDPLPTAPPFGANTLVDHARAVAASWRSAERARQGAAATVEL
jgi:hypothetical protein